MEERWVDIIGYEGLYMISNLGRIWIYSKGVKKMYCKNGYIIVRLWKNSKHKYFSVHRLVAQHFVNNPKNKPEVNHKDTNKANNHYSNLEWCTRKENQVHASDNNLFPGSKGWQGKFGKNHTSSIPVKQLSLSGETIKIYDNARFAARETGFASESIRRAIKGFTIRYGRIEKFETLGGFKWEYIRKK